MSLFREYSTPRVKVVTRWVQKEKTRRNTTWKSGEWYYLLFRSFSPITKQLSGVFLIYLLSKSSVWFSIRHARIACVPATNTVKFSSLQPHTLSDRRARARALSPPPPSLSLSLSIFASLSPFLSFLLSLFSFPLSIYYLFSFISPPVRRFLFHSLLIS